MDTTAERTTKQPTRSRRGERAAGLVEYALLVALISLACLGALSVLGGSNGGSISSTASKYDTAIN